MLTENFDTNRNPRFGFCLHPNPQSAFRGMSFDLLLPRMPDGNPTLCSESKATLMTIIPHFLGLRCEYFNHMSKRFWSHVTQALKFYLHECTSPYCKRYILAAYPERLSVIREQSNNIVYVSLLFTLANTEIL